MELRDYVKIIGKRIWLLVIVVILTTLASYLFTFYSPTTYDASASIDVMVKRTATSDNSQNQYDDYYAFQASSSYADAIISWLKDPGNVNQMNGIAGNLNAAAKSQDVAKSLKAKKLLPAIVALEVNVGDQGAAKAMVDSAIEVVKAHTSTWQKENMGKDFQLVISDPVVNKNIPNVSLNTLIGFVSGLVLGLAIVFLVEYFSKKD